MHKDIFRHSSTRRPSPASSRDPDRGVDRGAADDVPRRPRRRPRHGPGGMDDGDRVGLLVGLGIYVYLGAHAEVALLRQRGAVANACRCRDRIPWSSGGAQRTQRRRGRGETG